MEKADNFPKRSRVDVWLENKRLNTYMSVGRLELPTNGLKGHCSTIELHAHNQVIIVARDPLTVNIEGWIFIEYISPEWIFCSLSNRIMGRY